MWFIGPLTRLPNGAQPKGLKHKQPYIFELDSPPHTGQSPAFLPLTVENPLNSGSVVFPHYIWAD